MPLRDWLIGIDCVTPMHFCCTVVYVIAQQDAAYCFIRFVSSFLFQRYLNFDFLSIEISKVKQYGFVINRVIRPSH